MRRNCRQAKGWARFVIVIAALAFSACSTLTPEPDPIDEQPEIVILPPDATVEPIPPAKPTKPIEPPQPPTVAIVVTSSQPAYADVAEALTHHFEDAEIYDLSDKSLPPVSALRLINDSDSRAVIAIGLRAAQSSVAMAGVPVIFSQVFNYQDHELLNANSRGVAALPPFDAQIAAWKKIDPTVARFGIIVGEGHDDLIAEAELAAERHGVDLRVQIAHSDQEMLYLFKRMVRNIDGYWLLPDNRILSARVLQELLDEAKQQNVPVAVPNESMLKLGGAISFSTVASDIAETIVNIILQIQAGKLDRVPAVTSLSEIRVATNDEQLRKPAVAKSSTQDSILDVDR
ncbi:MAG: hypothetical protein OEU90_12885 [Gammaproteobacteria bacterium]|nr:hypothetical protein [Gammaproteobacteria bacterium]MDH3806350.1 hypothetical protein [Gammaproteobacteria bacterium]